MTAAGSRPYRLSLGPGLEPFRPELEFACRFLDRAHPVARSDRAETVLHYGPGTPAGAVEVPALVFPDAVRLDGDGIHPDFAGLARIEEREEAPRLLPPREAWTGRAAGDGGPGAGAAIGYDALGLVFLLLSRLEERGNPANATERYRRFPIEASLLHRRARVDVPLADIAARDLAAALLGTPDPPSRTGYRAWLTHDVDRLRGYHYPTQPLKLAAGDVIFRRDPLLAVKRLGKAVMPGEPWRSTRQIMDLSERHGLTSRFYFMGPTRASSDSPYLLREPGTVRRLADEIAARGHVLGFHPGFRTRRDPEEWRRQKEGLEAVIGRPVAEGRHHGMLFDAETTWDMWDDAGMVMDASIGFPGRSGFPTGTCRSHPTYSLKRRRTLDLVEYPSNILDFGFFGGRYRDLGLDEALAEAQGIVDTCRAIGGDLVILFHTSQPSGLVKRFYERLLERL